MHSQEGRLIPVDPMIVGRHQSGLDPFYISPSPSHIVDQVSFPPHRIKGYGKKMVKKDKGKARAVDVDPEPTERSPLLGHGSPSHSHYSPRPVHPHIAAIQNERARESRTRPILYIALIVSLSLLAAFGLFLALLLNSFRPSVTELDTLQDTAFQYKGPDGISIVKITDDGILVNVSLRAGIDWDRALGIQRWTDEEEKQEAVWKGDRGTGADWWESLRQWTAWRMMSQLSEPTVQVTIPDQVLVLPDHFDSFPLLEVSVPSGFGSH
jgi:hypothetical protein